MKSLLLVLVLAWSSVALAQDEPPPPPPPEQGAPGQPPEPPPAEVKTVRVTAEGYNRDDAIKQALRKALEQGAGVQLAGYSQT